jgi:hypothetical protein
MVPTGQEEVLKKALEEYPNLYVALRIPLIQS